MIAYTTFGTNNLLTAAEFYDELFALMGVKRIFDMETFVAWGKAEGEPMFCITHPFDGQDASVGNGTMVALAVQSTDIIDQMHAKALAMGGQNEGDPGLRMEKYYCAYFRDLDGNKLNLFYVAAN